MASVLTSVRIRNGWPIPGSGREEDGRGGRRRRRRLRQRPAHCLGPDSKHVAYWAKQGEEWLLVIDGVEVKRWEGFGSQPVFGSGSSLHVMVLKDSSVYLAEVQISGNGAMVKAKPAAPAVTPPLPPVVGRTPDGKMHFSYNISNGPFTRRVIGTAADPQGLANVLRRCNRRPAPTATTG